MDPKFRYGFSEHMFRHGFSELIQYESCAADKSRLHVWTTSCLRVRQRLRPYLRLRR